jgi:class 3 adenylate cyclase
MRDPAGAVDGEVDASAAVEPRRRDGTEIRTFLIADVRGYTRFTHERGDEAAAVFESPRQAIRTAVALQERFVEHTLDNPALPLRVGIGIDAGEAVPVEGGYRGGALNLAARLCSQAGPGQVLASGETAHFARRVDGLEYVEHGRLQVKGLQEPVRVVRVVPSDGDPADRLPEPEAPTSAPGSWRDRRGRIALVGGLVVLGAIAVAVVLARSPSDPAPVVVPEDSVAVVDQETGRVVEAVRVGGRPGEIVVSGDSAWIANESDSTVTRVDLETREVVQTIGLGFEPTGMAAGGGAVWVVGGFQRRLVRIDPDGRIRLTVGFEGSRSR